MRGGSTLDLEFPFWKLPLLIVSAFKGVNFQKRLFTPPLGGILGPFSGLGRYDSLCLAGISRTLACWDAGSTHLRAIPDLPLQKPGLRRQPARRTTPP